MDPVTPGYTGLKMATWTFCPSAEVLNSQKQDGWRYRAILNQFSFFYCAETKNRKIISSGAASKLICYRVWEGWMINSGSVQEIGHLYAEWHSWTFTSTVTAGYGDMSNHLYIQGKRFNINRNYFGDTFHHQVRVKNSLTSNQIMAKPTVLLASAVLKANYKMLALTH